MGKKRESTKKNNVFAKLGIVLIVLIVIISGAVSLYLGKAAKPLNADTTDTVLISIPSGSGTGTIAEILVSNKIINSASNFKLLSKIEGNDGKFKAGSYSLSPSMSYQEIVDSLISGNSATTRFTIPEGLTLSETADRLADKNLINTDAFMKAAESSNFDYKFMSLLPNGSNRLEGFLYPETYDVFTNASEEDILIRMLSQFDKLVTEEYYTRAAELGYDMYDIVTIASLIEKETRVSAERATVASVIYNRMAINMPLQIDATVQYALGNHKERLDYNDTEVDSPYNTYQHIGLPPGPICSPSIDSIKAALYPDTTNYYYYVLKPEMNGAHNFSNTYEEFLKNKKAYLKAL
ncbi:endolytic transglycosylase MltG [Clostridium aminobutyricum]|uniref:Endolytic murein transglycosylase n=1 Tax=Clostridium aminobutyricum TaxID=33953 RepID=A0A939IHW1_CLOAM|nr:endolytic transglycosylase MltG [Clostridium aminobutyricum]MBN7772451.1 endolytic transglycosylase MltG [Clostridium aminobutyricum]